jgi:hypothetical protein
MAVDLIINSQQGSDIAALKLLNRFKPLLKKYARLLSDEDGFYEMQANFLQIIQSMDIILLAKT